MHTFVKLAIRTVLLAGLLAGCGGTDEPDASDPGDTMLTLVGYYQKEQYGRAWELLHPDHQQIVSRSKFDECVLEEPGSIPANADFDVVEVYDETIDVAGLGSSATKAVTLKITIGAESENLTRHLVESSGWRWVLTSKDYEAYKKGDCPNG